MHERYVFIRSTDEDTFDALIEEVRRLHPSFQTEYGPAPQATRIKLVGRLSISNWGIEQRLRTWATNYGWEYVRQEEPNPVYMIYRCPINPTQPVGAGTIPDIGDQLEKLAKLRQSNTMTEAEYAAAKRKLLGL